MDRRRTARGDQQQQKLSVKALGQMFEELIRVTVSGSDSSAAFTASNNSRNCRKSEVESNRYRGTSQNKEDKSGDCSKPAITTVDSNHVKSRKQFFEGQTHTPETSGGKTILSNEKSRKFEGAPYLKNRSSREICACDVKSKRQIFEDYANSVVTDNIKSSHAKPMETIALQQKRFYNDILNPRPVFTGYPTLKNNVLEDISTNDKEYVSTFQYRSSTTIVNNNEDVGVAVSDKEYEIMQENKEDEEEYKSIDVEFDSIEKCSTCGEGNFGNYKDQDILDINGDDTKRYFENEKNNKLVEEGYMAENNIPEDNIDNNGLSNGKKETVDGQENQAPNKSIEEFFYTPNINEENRKDTPLSKNISGELSEDLTQNNDELLLQLDDVKDHLWKNICSHEADCNRDNAEPIEDGIPKDIYSHEADCNGGNVEPIENGRASNYIEMLKDINITMENLEKNHEERKRNANEENKFNIEEEEEVSDLSSKLLIDECNENQILASSEDLIKIKDDGLEENNVFIFSSTPPIDKSYENAENINQGTYDDYESIMPLSDYRIKVNDEDIEENIAERIYVNTQENIDPFEDERMASLQDTYEKSSTIPEEHVENIYHNILQVSSIDAISENIVEGVRSFPLPRTTLNNSLDNEDPSGSQSPSEIRIEECISDVTEAFESINVLFDKPRWNVWDISKNQNAITLADLEDEVFGDMLDMDNEFCVETFNNGEESVLFKIWYGREVLTQESEYDYLPTNINVNRNRDFLNKTDDEDPEYSFIDDDDDRDDISGTFFDKDENPRIQIIGDHGSNDLHIPQLDIPKAQYMIIKELIDSEEIYLNKMKYIIDNYLQHFRNIEVSPDIEIVFGNIEEICNETEKMHSTLKECVSIDEIARVFLTNVRVFDYYTEYMKNKGKSIKYTNEQFSELIKNRQVELEDQYTCESYFCNVIERPTRYRSLLEKLKKSVAKSGVSCEALDEAIIMLDRKIEETNTILAITSIKLCPIDLKEMEPFVMKETFNIKRKYKSVVFLFRGGVIFCVEDQDETGVYDYVECIEMDKLAIRHSNSSMCFQLSCFDKSKRSGDANQYEFNIEAPSMAVKEKWVDEVQRILWCQLQYYKDQQKNATILSQNQQNTVPNTAEDGEDQYEEVFVANGGSESASNSQKCIDDEYVAIQDVVYEEERDKISGTFFDKHENPRIEIIRSESFMGDGVYMENVPKTQYMIIKELINTEETYLRKMKHIIDSYYLYFKSIGAPPDIQVVFGNIQEIYDETEKLYSKFLECDSVDTIAKVFLNNTHIFDLYTDYMRNKSTSYYYANTKFKRLIKDRQVELEDQYTCDSYLLNPVQRPGRYKLLLEKLEKELFKTNETSPLLKEAVALVNEKITETNTLMTIDSIKKCPINLQNMGPFIMKEAFNIRRKYRSVIFLFRDIIVFCTEDQSRPDIYIYADSIEMTKLTISHNRSSTSFQLRNFDKSKLSEENKYTFDVEAASMSIKERWMDEIQRLLWGQLQYFKDQQKRTSLNKLGPTMSFIRKGSMKEKTKPYDSNTKTRKRSTFYYDIK